MFKKLIDSAFYQAVSFITTVYGAYGIVKTVIIPYIKTFKVDTVQKIPINYQEIYVVSFLIGITMLMLHYYPRVHVYVKSKFRPNPKKLRERCLRLSESILAFVNNRNRLNNVDADRIERYAIETKALFSKKYSKELGKVYKKIQLYANNNKELEYLYKNHNVKKDMIELGEILKKIAKTLPEY